jgi:hypothetical protein
MLDISIRICSSKQTLRDQFILIDLIVFNATFRNISCLPMVGGSLQGTPASSTTKTGRHDVAEIFLKVALNTIKSININ